MAQIEFLYLAMLTRSNEYAGTDSAIMLSINDAGVDRLNHRFEDTYQKDQERGQANLYRLDVRSQGIESSRLVDGSVRVAILGEDQWRPEVFFLWGAASNRPLQPPRIVPLAMESEVETKLSINDTGAIPSIPLRLVRTGGADTLINRLMFMTITEYDTPDEEFSWNPLDWFGHAIIGPGGPPGRGTDDPIELQVTANGALVTRNTIPDTSQEDFESNQANLYSIPVAVPFTRASMRDDAVKISIGGDDFWRPEAVYLFGLDNTQGRPTSVVPLVHVDKWDFKSLSTDSTEGEAQVALPLLPPLANQDVYRR